MNYYNVLAVLIILSALLWYFSPSIVASRRKHPSQMGIAALNLFLGWTGLGWLIAMIWALSNNREKQTVVVVGNAPVETSAPAATLPETNPRSTSTKARLVASREFEAVSAKLSDARIAIVVVVAVLAIIVGAGVFRHHRLEHAAQTVSPQVAPPDVSPQVSSGSEVKQEEQPQASHTISIAMLQREYQALGSKVDSEFHGRVVETYGRIHEVKLDNSNAVTLVMDTSDGDGYAVAELEQTQQVPTTGQLFQGKVLGMLCQVEDFYDGSVHLNRCEIEASPDIDPSLAEEKDLSPSEWDQLKNGFTSDASLDPSSQAIDDSETEGPDSQ